MLTEINPALTQEVEKELRRLRISGTLKGLQYLVWAVSQAVQEPEIVQYVTKGVYNVLAERYKIERPQIERTIRTAVKYSWENGGRDALDQMAGYHLEKRPTNSEFIDLVAAHIRHR